MKFQLFTAILIIFCQTLSAQERLEPIIKNYGGVYDIEGAVIKPDPEIKYQILLELVTQAEDPASINYSYLNVARLLNLHAVGEVPAENLDVVLTVHGPATYCLLNNEAYKNKYGVENPNIELIEKLYKAGVEITVCGQSLIARNIPHKDLLDMVQVATSMLTTATTYQLKGYAFLKF